MRHAYPMNGQASPGSASPGEVSQVMALLFNISNQLGAIGSTLNHHGSMIEYNAQRHDRHCERLELMDDKLAALAQAQAAAKASGGEKVPIKEKLQIAIFLLSLIAVALGKLPWEKAVTVFGKPLGF